MIIRKANLADLDLLIRLRLDYLRTDKDNLTAEEETIIGSQLAEYFPKHIHQDLIVLLAEIDQKAVSTAFLVISEKPANPSFITGKTGTLLNVFAYPEYRRQGIATKIIAAIIEEAKKEGLSYIDLSASEDGKPLYEKFGFIEPKSKYTPMKLQLV